MKQPEWMKYDSTSARTYLDLEDLDSVPLLSNYPGESFDSIDLEPQRLVPLYLDF